MSRLCMLGFALFTKVLAEGPATEQNASDPVAGALAAKQRAWQHAEASIHALHGLNARLNQDLKVKNLSLIVAQNILSKVQSSFSGKHAELESRFTAAIRALDPVVLAAANASEVDKAEDVARELLEEFKHLDHTEAHAMRSKLGSLEEAGKAKARAMWQEAKEAAHHVYASGMAAAEAQRDERAQGETEEVSERLLGRAEEAAERAEGLVERQSGRVEHRLESMMDKLQDEAQDALEARQQRFDHAKDLVHKARKAAQRKAARPQLVEKESVQMEAGSKEATHKEAVQKESAGERTTSLTTFLAETGGITLLAEGLAKEHNVSDPVRDTQAAEHDASQHAEAVLKELRRWDATLEQDIESDVQGIRTKVQTTYSGKRDELQRKFDAAVEALTATTMVTANSSEVKEDEDAVKDVMDKLKHLDHAEAHAMRSILHSIEKAEKVKGRAEMAKSRALWKEAREAARRVYKSGMAAARAQRSFFGEMPSERTRGEAEKASERLLLLAEKVAEKAEGHAERRFDHMEKMMDSLEDKAHDTREARRQRFHRAKDMVHEARRAARARAAEQQSAQKDTASEHTANPNAHEKEPAQKDSDKKIPKREEPIERQPVQKESASEHVATPKAPQQEPSQQQATREEASKQEAPKQEAPKHEEPKHEALKEEAPKHEAPKEESKQAAAKQDAPKQDAIKQEAALQEDTEHDATTEEKASPAAFLAARTSQEVSVALMAPLACASVVAVAAALLAVRSCRRTVDIDQPMLG